MNWREAKSRCATCGRAINAACLAPTWCAKRRRSSRRDRFPEFGDMVKETASTYRTHTCGALRPGDVGASVTLLGWVHRVRDLGGVIFFDVRDRHGVTQVVVRTGAPCAPVAGKVRPEFVVRVAGVVDRRSAETINPKLDTGEVEVVAAELEILNEAKTPPFPINEDTVVSE